MDEVNTHGDSSELEALFDSIAAGVAHSVVPPAVLPISEEDSPAARAEDGSGQEADSEELQDLFDSVAQTSWTPAAAAGAVAAGPADAGGNADAEWSGQKKVFDQVGQMVRQLHETLRALGYDRVIQNTVNAIPDARDRLSYISNLTEQAASRVLNATDVATPLQDELEEGAALLAEKWDMLYANRMGVDDFKLLANDTREFLRTSVPRKAHETKDQLLEIMMAQDFQDLTGQVIKKLIVLAQSFESQLMDVLIEAMPGEKRTESVNSMLNGPVINANGRTDVVADQKQVDDLLDSLGF